MEVANCLAETCNVNVEHVQCKMQLFLTTLLCCWKPEIYEILCEKTATS
jgi:hypothetical protein